MEDIQTWWQIPSIVYFCKVFDPICKDIFPIDVCELECAIEANSVLLTDMAIRFMKICGVYNKNSNKWWDIMKKHFKNKCDVYNFEYLLDSVASFDDLTRKQKVDALYILCHLILDNKKFQEKIARKPEISEVLNVKPLGYDKNKSVYWYFGDTQLYREDFKNVFDVPTNSPKFQDCYKNIPTEPYSSGIFGPGKWIKICNNYKSWCSLADITEHSQNENDRSLHTAICNIIQTLPPRIRKKRHYTYLVPPSNLALVNTHGSTFKTKNYGSLIFRPYNTRSNTNVCNESNNILQVQNEFRDEHKQIEESKNEKSMILQHKHMMNTIQMDNNVDNSNDFNFIKVNDILFNKDIKIILKRCDQENLHNVKKITNVEEIEK